MPKKGSKTKTKKSSQKAGGEAATAVGAENVQSGTGTSAPAGTSASSDREGGGPVPGSTSTGGSDVRHVPSPPPALPERVFDIWSDVCCEFVFLCRLHGIGCIVPVMGNAGM